MTSQKPHRILGIDPGLTACGWGVVDVMGSRIIHVANGTVKPPIKAPMAERLHTLMTHLKTVIQDYQPHSTALEEVFVNKNPNSTLKLGQARGVALVTPALFHIPVYEYQNRTVKKAIVGTGTANKDQIHMMVNTLLPSANPDSEHSADALAIAMTHAHTANTTSVWTGSQVTQ